MEHNERIDSGAGEPVLACKRRKHLRLAALAVCCALLGGIAGGAATGLLLQGRERAAMRPAGQQTAVSGGALVSIPAIPGISCSFRKS